MKFGAMLGDILRSLVRQAATERYPLERRQMPKRTRGLLDWDATQCTGCGLCARDCPAQALEVIVLDRKARRFVVRYHADRCTFCGQCVSSCRFGCLRLANDAWAPASTNRAPFTLIYGSEEDVADVLAGSASEDTPLPAQP